MASGPDAAFAAADAALEACAKQVYRLGAAPGIGSTVKAVNQLLAGINLVTAAEGMAFGVALGADPKVLYEVIRNAAGGSWMFENRVPHMLDDDYAPRSAVDIWVKDLGLVLDTGKALRMPLPMAAAAYQVVMMAAAKGLGPIDDAAFVKVYESFTGKPVAAKDGRTTVERVSRRVGCQGPSTKRASSSPGQGGMVTATAASGSAPSLRSWNRVPVGIASDTPGRDRR